MFRYLPLALAASPRLAHPAKRGTPDIFDHEVCIASRRYTPMDAQGIPIGRVASTKNTRFDFETPRLRRTFDKSRLGHDINLVLNNTPRTSQLQRHWARAGKGRFAPSFQPLVSHFDKPQSPSPCISRFCPTRKTARSKTPLLSISIGYAPITPATPRHLGCFLKMQPRPRLGP